MELKTVLLVTAALLTVGTECVHLQERCVASQAPTSDVGFSLYAHRNKTGYIESEIQLEIDNKTGQHFPENKGHWKVDLKQKTYECNGGSTVQIIATLSGPPLKKPGSIQRPPLAPGYELNHSLGSYYKFHTTPQTWDEARRICQEEGTHLAVLNSEAEARALKNFPKLAAVAHNDQAIIGFHDRFIEGEYLTVLGKTIAQAGYARWFVGNPGVVENCGSMFNNGELNDIPCSDFKLGFYCEKELSCC